MLAKRWDLINKRRIHHKKSHPMRFPLLCLCFSLRPPLQLHSSVQPWHSSLRAADQSLIHPPPLFLLSLLVLLKHHPGPQATPLQGSDHLTGQRESGHPGAPWAVDRDGHHGTRPAGEAPGREETLDPHCPVLVHRVWACWRGQQPLEVVDSSSREEKVERWTSSRSPVSAFIPAGGKGSEGVDGGPAGDWRRRKHHEANGPVASFSSPPPLQRPFKFRAQRSFTGCSEKRPHFLFLLFLFHLALCLHHLRYPQLQTQNERAQEPLQAPLVSPLLRRARLGSLLHCPTRVQPAVLPGQLPAGAPLRLPFSKPCHHPDTHQGPGRWGRPFTVLRALQIHAHERAGRAQEEGGVQGAGGYGGRVVHVPLKSLELTWMTQTLKHFKRHLIVTLACEELWVMHCSCLFTVFCFSDLFFCELFKDCAYH